MAMNAISSDEASFSSKGSDLIFKNDYDSVRSSAGVYYTPCASPLNAANLTNKQEKSPQGKKKSTDMLDSIPSPGPYSIPSSSPRLITITEAHSRAKNNSSSKMGTSFGMMLRELKISGSSSNDSHDSYGAVYNESSEISSSAPVKRHTGGDSYWEAIQLVSSKDLTISFSHFKLLKRIGYGDIGSVYLVELKGTSSIFAMKIMDKPSLVTRNKLLRAQTEREILSLLDHPFLPTLYAHFETEKFYCLVMEYCSGGNLHSLRQRQPNKYFTEKTARFYVSEVLLAIEYLHMLGIVYRDLKPENVLVRDNGHIMLSDFDLSLQCAVSPTLVNSTQVQIGGSSSSHGRSRGIHLSREALQGCILQPSSLFPRILPKKSHKSKLEQGSTGSHHRGAAMPELMAEPTNARSMSFVGTHEYLAPEIIRGEGHGSAVDWWTFGVFLYELMYGTTPFKGSGNRATLFNVVGQPLMFPEVPAVGLAAKELIRGLLVKEPQKRIGYRRGATEIKQHPFFEGVNWALVRSATPPHVPDPVDVQQSAANKEERKKGKKMTPNGKSRDATNDPEFQLF